MTPRLIVRDLQRGHYGTKLHLRFSVTLELNGEPWMTVKGWRLNAEWKVQGPSIKLSGGRWYRIIEQPPEAEEALIKALAAMPEVTDFLGHPPDVDDIKGWERLTQALPGEAEVDL
jgi:hypothetical protein